MRNKLLRPWYSVLAIAAALMLPAIPTADAGKEVFVRSKPHVNVGPSTGQTSTKSKATTSGGATAHPDFLWSPTSPRASGEQKGGWKAIRGGGLRID